MLSAVRLARVETWSICSNPGILHGLQGIYHLDMKTEKAVAALAAVWNLVRVELLPSAAAAADK